MLGKGFSYPCWFFPCKQLVFQILNKAVVKELQHCQRSWDLMLRMSAVFFLIVKQNTLNLSYNFVWTLSEHFCCSQNVAAIWPPLLSSHPDPYRTTPHILSITYFEITFIKILIIIFGIKDDIVSEYCKVAWAEPCFNNVTNVLIRVDIKMLLLRQELFFQCHLCCKYGSSGMSIAQLLNYPVIREKTLCSCIRLMLGPRGNNFFFLPWVLLFPSTCLSKHQDSRKTKLTSFPRDLISSVSLYSWTFT